MTWRVQVDGGTCIGSGLCAGTAPEHFALVGSRSRPRQEVIEPDDAALDAAVSCPVEAIGIRDLTDGRILAP